MPRHALSSLIFLVSGITLGAQGIYQNANSPNDPICPLVQKDKTSLNFGGNGTLGSTGGLRGADTTATLSYQQGARLFPQGQRKDASSFAAYDVDGKPLSVASLKGKVVLIGLWSTRCDPSAKMLMEFSALYGKRAQFGFEILAVNFDLNQQDDGSGGVEGGWRAINKFKIKNKAFFETSKMPVYTPGLGKEGASVFMDIIYSLPTLFVVDREGQWQAVYIGYKDGFVGEALKRVILEKPLPPAPVPPPPPTP